MEHLYSLQHSGASAASSLHGKIICYLFKVFENIRTHAIVLILGWRYTLTCMCVIIHFICWFVQNSIFHKFFNLHSLKTAFVLVFYHQILWCFAKFDCSLVCTTKIAREKKESIMHAQEFQLIKLLCWKNIMKSIGIMPIYPLHRISALVKRSVYWNRAFLCWSNRNMADRKCISSAGDADECCMFLGLSPFFFCARYNGHVNIADLPERQKERTWYRKSCGRKKNLDVFNYRKKLHNWKIWKQTRNDRWTMRQYTCVASVKFAKDSSDRKCSRPQRSEGSNIVIIASKRAEWMLLHFYSHYSISVMDKLAMKNRLNALAGETWYFCTQTKWTY